MKRLTGFDTHEIDTFLTLDGEEKANAAPPLPEAPASRLGTCGCWVHRVLCGDATNTEAVRRLLDESRGSWPALLSG